jgi:hypothetical protein
MEDMMDNIFKAFEQLENYIYKILIGVILIPKTLLRIVIDPTFAPRYIKDEKEKGDSRFDEYFSPIWLLLVVALVPFVVWQFIPTPGAEISSSYTDKPKSDRNPDFDAKVTFVSAVTASTGSITTYWRVEKEDVIEGRYHYLPSEPVKHTNNYENNLSKASSSIKSNLINGLQNINSIGKNNPKENKNSNNDYFEYDQIDSHTIRDIYPVSSPSESPFNGAGNYWVVFEASKFDNDHKLIETYETKIFVHVPESKDENVTVDARSRPDAKFTLSEVQNQLESENTIFLALGLLFPPLLFALVMKSIGKDLSGTNSFEDVLSEDSLKEIYLIQCYYFAPLASMFWATRYAGHFLTPDVFYRFDTKTNLIILLPLILVFFWFISVQTHAIVKERNISLQWALIIVLGCILVLCGGVLFIVFSNVPTLQDYTRKIAIWVYPLLAVGLLASYYKLATFWRREKGQATEENQTAEEKRLAEEERLAKEKKITGTFDKVLARGILVIIFVTLMLVLFQGNSTDSTSQKFDDDQQTAVAALVVDHATAVADHATAVATRATALAATATVFAQLTAMTEVPSTESSVNSSNPAATAVADTSTPDLIPTRTLIPTPTSTPSEFYRVRFSSNLNVGQWHNFVSSGDESAVVYDLSADKLNVQFTPYGNDIYSYLENTEFSYTDVQVETTTDNIGANPNAVGLVCRASDAGWYEFEIDNLGNVTIYAYDGSYNPLASGQLSAINPDSATNTYSAVCKGNNLELYVNDIATPVATAQDERFKEGYIGLVASSVDGQPVNVDFDYIKVSQP